MDSKSRGENIQIKEKEKRGNQMKKAYPAIVLCILMTLSILGCGAGKPHPSDTAAKILVPTHTAYEGFEQTLLRLYDTSKLSCKIQPRPIEATDVLCSVY